MTTFRVRKTAEGTSVDPMDGTPSAVRHHLDNRTSTRDLAIHAKNEAMIRRCLNLYWQENP